MPDRDANSSEDRMKNETQSPRAGDGKPSDAQHGAEILFHEALAWGHAYGPAMGQKLWDEMRTEMAKKFVERLDPTLTDAYAEGRKDEAEESARLKAALDDAWKVLRMVDDNNRAEAGEPVKSWRGSFVVEEVQRVLSGKLDDYAKRPADDMLRLPPSSSGLGPKLTTEVVKAALLLRGWADANGLQPPWHIAHIGDVAATPAVPTPRPFDAVKSFANSVLAMLDERIKAAERNAHPFMDKFGDHPETIVAAQAQAGELREVRTQVRILGDRALVDLMKFKPVMTSREQTLADALETAYSHLEMDKLRISHSKDADILDRAVMLAKFPSPATADGSQS